MSDHCSGCGADIQDTGAEYAYCAACEDSRKHGPVLVYEYVGGRLGGLPNARNIAYYFQSEGFTFSGVVNGFNIFASNAAQSPMGNVAIQLRPDLIVNGRAELDALLADPEFAAGKLPSQLSHISDPAVYQAAIQARKDSGQ